MGSLFSMKEVFFPLGSLEKLGIGVDGDRPDQFPSPKKTQCHIHVFTKRLRNGTEQAIERRQFFRFFNERISKASLRHRVF